MRRKIISLLIVLSLISSFCINTIAYERKDHDKIMRYVLFGKDISESSLADEPKTALSALEAACYLTLDQYNGKGVAELIVLKNKRIKDIPKEISTIDFSGNQHHRKYTHKGWDYDYRDDKAKWTIRKPILINTVNKVLDFGFASNLPFIEPSNKCKSFAAFLYYLHVLGDYLVVSDTTAPDSVNYFVKNDNDKGDIIDFVNSTNNCLVSEVNKHLRIIFDDQEEDVNKLIDRLNDIAVKAKKIYLSVDNREIRGESADQLSDYIKEYRKSLEEYVPSMLEKEDFFKNVFYPEETSWLPWK